MNPRPMHADFVAARDDGIKPGQMLLDVKNVSLRFGGVKFVVRRVTCHSTGASGRPPPE